MKIDELQITVDINESTANYDQHLAAEVILIDKAGRVMMSWIDDRHCEASLDCERFHACIQTIFGMPALSIIIILLIYLRI